MAGCSPLPRATPSSANQSAKAAPPRARTSLANLASRSKSKTLPGLTVVSLRGLGAVEGAIAEGSGSWARSNGAGTVARGKRNRLRAILTGVDIRFTARSSRYLRECAQEQILEGWRVHRNRTTAGGAGKGPRSHDAAQKDWCGRALRRVYNHSERALLQADSPRSADSYADGKSVHLRAGLRAVLSFSGAGGGGFRATR